MSGILLEAARSLSGEVWHHAVLALLHTLWQAGVLAGLWWLLARRIAATRARLRYGLVLGMLGAVVVAGLVAFALLEQPVRARAADSGLSRLADHPRNEAGWAVEAVQGQAASLPSRPNPERSSAGTGGTAVSSAGWTCWAALAWLAGLAVMLGRLTRCVRHAGRLRRQTAGAASVRLREVMDDLLQRAPLRRPVRLALTTLLRTPATVGVIWPVVLVPASLASELPVEQLRLMLAHELAHIRRWDYLVNVGQLLVEAILFFNPAVWWLSRQVRLEREACCDAAAIAWTGRRMDYAQTLADCARRLGAPGTGWGQRVPAFADSGRTGPVVERLRRIVRPQRRPEVALPWYSLAGVTVACLLLLGLLQNGTFLAVAAAQKLLSPQQRQAKMEEVRRDFGGPDGNENSAELSLNPANNIEIKGVVRLADGRPAPRNTIVMLNVQSASAGLSAGCMTDGQGAFSYQARRGVVYAMAQADGYAPARIGPLRGDDTQALHNIRLTLETGFAASIVFVDPAGRPIPGARVNTSLKASPSSHMGGGKYTADDQGRLTIDHCGGVPMRVAVTAAGYQFDQRDLTFGPNHPLTWMLQTARPTTGLVLGADGRPVAGATARQLSRRGFADIDTDPSPNQLDFMPVLATSDARGRLVFTSLRDNCSYAVYISAPGCGPEIVHHVQAGDGEVLVKLGPPRTIHGRIVGDLSTLADKSGGGQKKHELRYELSYRAKENVVHSWSETTEVKAVPGGGTFQIDNVPPCQVSFDLGADSHNLDMTPTGKTAEVTLDLRPVPTVQRPVMVKLIVPPGQPMPTGKLRVDYVAPNHPNGYRPFWLPVDAHGVVRIDVPVPTKFRYETGELVGYWVAEKSEIPVPAGKEPLVLEVPAFPAGAIYGLVRGVDGQPCDRFNILVDTIKAPTGVAPLNLWSAQNHLRGDGSGRFVVSPLVLGGRYRLTVTSSDVGSPAAVVSEVFAIDAQHPVAQADLQFVEGRPVVVQVLGPDGKPAAGVRASLDLNRNSGGSSSTQRTTDRDGKITFQHVNSAMPGTYRWTIQAGPDTCGTSVPVDWKAGPQVIHLKKGLTARGLVIEARTGRPVPGAVVRLGPSEYDDGGFWGMLETRTNTKGEWSFANLEPRTYRAYVNDAVPVGTLITENADGSTSYTTPPGAAGYPDIVAGRTAPVALRVVLPPHSKLRPVGR